MKKFAKIGIIMLVFVITFVLFCVGCQKETNGPTPNEPSSSVNDASETVSTESKEDDSAMYEGKSRIKVLSYNIRCLRGGNSDAGYEPLSAAETTETIKNFSSLLDSEDPDIFIVCENRMFFDAKATDAEGGSKNVYDHLFKGYFRYGYNLESGASLPRIYSKYKFLSTEYIDVNYAPGVGGGRRPLAVKIKVDNEEIYVIACHPEAGAEAYAASRKPYFDAIAEFCKDKENVIIAGDLNTDTKDFKAELDCFKEDFTFGNFGEFGTHQTYRFGESELWLDNILVKGLKMRNFTVGTEEYSDHFPIYSELYIMD